MNCQFLSAISCRSSRAKLPNRGLVALAAAGLLAGCASGPSYVDRQKIVAVDQESHRLMTDRLAEESAKLAAMQDELVKRLDQTRAVAVKPATPVFNPLDAVNVTLTADDTDVRLVFRAIADQAKLNLVLPAALAQKPRTISLALRNLPASQVFDHVLKAMDLHGTVERGVLVVKEYEERIFDLDFLQTAVSASFNAGGDVFGASLSTGSASSGGAGSGDSSQSGIRNGFNIRGRNTNDMDPFQQIEGLVKTIVGSGEQMLEKQGDRTVATQVAAAGPRFALNRSTGSLYVQARPSQMVAVSRVVDQYRSVLGRQVLIEAQIVDVELNDEFRYGIDWSRLKDAAAVHFGANAMELGSIISGVPNAANPARSLTIPAQVIGQSGTPQFGLAYSKGSQSLAINMLKTFGVVHVLSNPSLRVKNTQPAVVSVGRNERFISQASSNVSNSGGGQTTVSSNVVTGNLFDGVMLGVIPFISDDGVISLTINPVQTTITPGSTNLIDVGSVSSPMKISLPKVEFKGITTSLSLRSGDMVILGGLIGESGEKSKAGLPGITEVPVIGEAAGSINRSTRSRELILMLRVRSI